MAGFIPVMSRPLNLIVPRVGGKNEVSRLKHVVLPAPFGPIKAWIVPVSTRSETPSPAKKPPNSRARPSARLELVPVCRAFCIYRPLVQGRLWREIPRCGDSQTLRGGGNGFANR